MNFYLFIAAALASTVGYIAVGLLDALFTGNVRYLFRRWRDPLVSALCAEVEDGSLTQQGAYDVLWDKVPLYGWVAVRNNHRDSSRIFAAAMRRSAYEMGIPDRAANRLVAGMLAHEGPATESDVERYLSDAS